MNPWILAGAGLAVVLLGLVVLVVLRRRRRSLEGRLRRLSWHALADITLPDDVDGRIHVDLLLMTAAGLLVLEVRRMEGTVFAADQLDSWTVLHPRGRRTVLRNPLPGLKARLHAVRALVPDVPVSGYVVVVGDPAFSGSPPEEVVTDRALEALVPARQGPPPEALTAAWATLRSAAGRDRR